MAYRFSLSSLKPGKKSFFSQEFINLQIRISDFNKMFDNLYISKNSSVDSQLISSGQIFDLILSQVDEICIGIDESSFTGVYISHKNEKYNVTMFSPANDFDWIVFLHVLDYFHDATNNDIYDTDGNLIDLKYLKNNYEQEMQNGHLQIINQNLDEEMLLSLRGINGPVYLNKDIVNKYNNYDEFQKFLYQSQWNDSVITNPITFLAKNTYLFTAYTIFTDTLTTIPKTPLINHQESKNIKQENNIFFIQVYNVESHEMISRHYYHDFIDSLNEDEYIWADANNLKIVISIERMLEISNTVKHFQLERYSK